jgi:hypothetical protein
MATTPMLDQHIVNIDEARKQFIDSLTAHIDQLRQELYNNELILHSVVQSVSKKTPEVQQLDNYLQQIRKVQGNLIAELDKLPVT